ncbi:winged helix-turn-helix domain-containing protein [Klebsiella aerogenes]|uniref:winged helix-turn-helix domain-containing protein n=1 Tax=Klebsiella aerogenes TaxID=548 RepID=UPI0018669D19|nr:winged helix-turn-helix domain-containing protein [Klebsiella aerogenes]
MGKIACQTYIVDDVVEFSPHEHTLYSKVNGNKINLLASASECFLCLLEKHGQLVTKKELVHIGWEQYNLHVSDSTFNQNIFTLRKALKDCGLNYEIIRTVPRKGLLVSETIKITPPGSKVEYVDDIHPADDQNEVGDALSIKNNFNFPYAIKLQLNLFFILLIIACTGGILTGLYITFPASYISSYKVISEGGDCHVKIDILRSSLADYKKFISSYNLHCKKNEHVYFSTYQYVPRISVLRCRYDFSQHHRNECVSWYFLDKKI